MDGGIVLRKSLGFVDKVKLKKEATCTIFDGGVGMVAEQRKCGMTPPVRADDQVTNDSRRVMNPIAVTAKLSDVWDSIVIHGCEPWLDMAPGGQ